jgi:tRNA pseudouridine38-40 synthase
MPRYRLTIEYDGGPYVGWQRQSNGPSVQAAIEAALFAITGAEVTVFGAGRTDTGVHAEGQVAHVDLERDWEGERLRTAIQAFLRDQPVTILEAAPAPDDFHCRFSATARHYLYRILNRRPPPALDLGRVWWVRAPLDAGAMHQAAQVLVGHHDFTTFRSTDCQAKSAMKTLDRLDVSRSGPYVEIRASSRSFLHNQVRSMAGTLKLVGEGKWTLRQVERALAARNRTACGPVAPACGLYLLGVDYPAGAFTRK